MQGEGQEEGQGGWEVSVKVIPITPAYRDGWERTFQPCDGCGCDEEEGNRRECCCESGGVDCGETVRVYEGGC